MLGCFLIGCAVSLVWGVKALGGNLERRYHDLESQKILDRHGAVIALLPNAKGYYATLGTPLPDAMRDMLIRKEDRFFYWHAGINPVSFSKAVIYKIFTGDNRRSSTITQQVVKNLLGNEQQRSVKNKLIESVYAISLELTASKKEILQMYADTAYLGNQTQGFSVASDVYFHEPLAELSPTEMMALVATLSSPSIINPRSPGIESRLAALAIHLDIPLEKEALSVQTGGTFHGVATDEFFELSPLIKDCSATCALTIDQGLSAKLREILRRNIADLDSKGVTNGAIVVFKEPEHELLAMIGSPDPSQDANGSRINMALEPRAIGSTGKPFITLLGFKEGLRPYTLVDDREYKFVIANGFPLYPKNYDGRYYGRVTIREALANSLNVPFVKILEYVTLDRMYDFLSHDLGFTPLRNFQEYQYGIALGGLDMDLMSLSHLFSIFPNEGVLKPVQLMHDRTSPPYNPPMVQTPAETAIADRRYIQLINRILSDRTAGVHEFGLKSDLNLPYTNYGVKTGTSRDYHDSWTVGFTPDLVVGVWIGNAEDKALDRVSGVTGAARIWNEAIVTAINSGYGSDRKFAFDLIQQLPWQGQIDIGLPGENPEDHRSLLVAQSSQLMTMPHDGDVFRGNDTTRIPLRSDKQVRWYINGAYLATSRETFWKPASPGRYTIEARLDASTREIITIVIE